MNELSIGSGIGTHKHHSKDVAYLQRIIGVYDDGMFGPKTLAAASETCGLFGIPFRGVVNSQVWAGLVHTIGEIPIAWGRMVSPEFRDQVRAICTGLSLNPNHLMNCMAFESGETFRADVKNMAGSGATGLIQFMPATARGMGTTVEALAQLTPEQQLSWVYRYFLPYRGRLTALEDVYMAILYPAAVGRDRNYPLFKGGTIAYRQNSGLDWNRDQVVSKWEAARAVYAKVRKGNMTAA